MSLEKGIEPEEPQDEQATADDVGRDEVEEEEDEEEFEEATEADEEE